MPYNQHDHHNPHPQNHQDIFAQLRAYRQQLDTWNQEQADIEQRLTAFRQRQQVLEAQLETWHRERDYLTELMEEEERKKREWQQKHQRDGNS